MSDTCKYCLQNVHADDMCHLHYRRFKRNNIDEKKIEAVESLLNKKCCLSNCRKAVFMNGLCNEHFHEVILHGTPKSLHKNKKKNTKASKCAIKKCHEAPAENELLCEEHTQQLQSIKENEDSYNDEIKGKLEGLKSVEVDLDEINYEDETFKMRQELDDHFVRELASSIRQIGLLHPPVLHKPKNSKKYRIVSGYCRFAALKLLSNTQPQYKKIRALLIDENKFSHPEMLKIAHEENNKRNYVSYLEQALKATELKFKQALSNREIASVMDLDDKGVHHLLKLVKKAHEDVLKALHKEQISFKHARILIDLERKQQKKYLQKVIDEELSTRELSKLIKEDKEDKYEEEFQEFMNNPPKGLDIKKTGRGKYELKANMEGIDAVRAFFRFWKGS